MKLVVFGANSPTGRLVTAMAMTAGHTVTAVTRRPADFPFCDHRVQTAAADVMDADAVDWVTGGHDAVVSVIGVPPSVRPVTVCSQATYNIVKAMIGHGMRRLLCVASADLDAADLSPAGLLRQRAIRPLVLASGSAVQRDVRRMENIVRESGLDWTLLRPGRLVAGSEVSDYRMTARPVPRPLTFRTDIAHALVREVTHGAYLGETVYVSSPK
ncbi:Putative NADH-flavin reductase [Streptomyces sp. yr375]|uniref:NAD(P)-dependent oxidoreductase n=1 Tax=Streptomyces sp. yr375 TaxID=1761906 RepID=UPI0008AD8AB1|nr:NAD(P)H-binding protein [Streptomyces sp. yr375]SER61391.1 Putative NADH-flavin reductase [Streptomyces sp. yr375]